MIQDPECFPLGLPCYRLSTPSHESSLVMSKVNRPLAVRSTKLLLVTPTPWDCDGPVVYNTTIPADVVHRLHADIQRLLAITDLCICARVVHACNCDYSIMVVVFSSILACLLLRPDLLSTPMTVWKPSPIGAMPGIDVIPHLTVNSPAVSSSECPSLHLIMMQPHSSTRGWRLALLLRARTIPDSHDTDVHDSQCSTFVFLAFSSVTHSPASTSQQFSKHVTRVPWSFWRCIELSTIYSPLRRRCHVKFFEYLILSDHMSFPRRSTSRAGALPVHRLL